MYYVDGHICTHKYCQTPTHYEFCFKHFKEAQQQNLDEQAKRLDEIQEDTTSMEEKMEDMKDFDERAGIIQ